MSEIRNAGPRSRGISEVSFSPFALAIVSHCQLGSSWELKGSSGSDLKVRGARSSFALPIGIAAPPGSAAQHVCCELSVSRDRCGSPHLSEGLKGHLVLYVFFLHRGGCPGVLRARASLRRQGRMAGLLARRRRTLRSLMPVGAEKTQSLR